MPALLVKGERLLYLRVVVTESLERLLYFVVRIAEPITHGPGCKRAIFTQTEEASDSLSHLVGYAVNDNVAYGGGTDRQSQR
jgi:hypothetical protein